MPRSSLDRRYLLDALAVVVPAGGGGQSVDAGTVGLMLRQAVSTARRHWRRLPLGYTVLAQTFQHGSSALLCARGTDGPALVWVEGICGSSARFNWFHHRFEESDFAGLGACRDGSHWWVMCPAREVGEGAWRVVLPRGECAVPAFDVWYPQLTQRWRGVGYARNI